MTDTTTGLMWSKATIGADRAATNFIPQERTVGPELPAPVRAIGSKR